ncbi:MAG: HAMP domain-containing histidine kinase, partial [Anaerolineae bacterium]|nr:HAMP domain-containing histidine kinase [Anaerolineae bacterium]
SVSHELRTPLSGITTLSEAMLAGSSGALSEVVREDLEVIHQSGQRLLGIISDILDMAAIRAGVMRLERRPCSPERLVKESLRVVSALPLHKPIRFEAHLPPGLPPILVDCGRIRQVMLNLLSNALKFSEQGVISVRAWQEGAWVLFAVRDQGIGIPQAYQARIFAPFRRLDSETGRRAGGTGLGLPISKWLVELHGGRLGVTSEPGEGSCFTFSVPVLTEGERDDEHPVCGGYTHSRACHEQGCPAVGRGLVDSSHRGGGAADAAS